MGRVFHDIKVNLDEDLEEKLAWLMPDYKTYHILRQSVDARRKHAPHLVYSVEAFGPNETPPEISHPIEKIHYSGPPALIIGAGPAGLFAALRLVERGIPCHLFEQGSDCVKRLKSINRYWRYGELDPKNNVGFGEGGAGLYSDGKLITRIKSPHIPYVMHRLVQFGAPEEILYLSNPHVGSDRIRRVIPKMRQFLIEQGCTFHFDTKVEQLLTENSRVVGIKTEQGEVHRSDHVIMACGHSAEDMFEHLHKIGVFMEGKSFALGLRIEHPQKLINELQYRDFAEHPKLGTANYRLAYHDHDSQTGVYSFCMCPGGYVLSAGTDNLGVVSNGMSNYRRNSPFANAAIVVSVDHDENFAGDLFGGLKFRQQLEQQAKHMVEKAGGTKEVPVQKVTDFFEGRGGEALKSSCPSGVVNTRLDQLLPANITEHLKKGVEKFNRSMKGFLSDEAQFHGIESRTSCPVRVTRDVDTLESVSHPGLYPTGEGAGYAGGITSAACDGIRVVEAIVQKVSSQAAAAEEDLT